MSICILTDQAKSQINQLCEDQGFYAISLNIKGGGCAGFEYEWDSINSQEDILADDLVIDTGTAKFVVGYNSLPFLVGSFIDYKSSLEGSAFEINNPNAESSCGCGVSINFDLESLEAS